MKKIAFVTLVLALAGCSNLALQCSGICTGGEARWRRWKIVASS